MEITEVRIKLMENSDDRLQAFCSITFDDAFVVRDLKIIDGTNGPFVAMPSRKLTAHCPSCGYKNHLRAAHCNQCGSRLKEDRTLRDHEGRTKLYADIAHPINSACREMIQARVIAEFKVELERSKQPGYVSRYDNDYDLDFEPLEAHPTIGAPMHSTPQHPAPPGPTTPPVPHVLPSPTESNVHPLHEKTHVAQPPEASPRGPHRAPVQQPASGQGSHKRTGNDNFGAGIFN